MPRRINDYAANDGWELMNLISTVGAFIVAAGMIPFLFNILYSWKYGEEAGDDPWEANTLEWATSSPPPAHNFNRLIPVKSERPLFDHRMAESGAGAGGASDSQPTAPQDG